MQLQHEFSLSARQSVAVQGKQAAHGIADRIKGQEQPAHFKRGAGPSYHACHLGVYAIVAEGGKQDGAGGVGSDMYL